MIYVSMDIAYVIVSAASMIVNRIATIKRSSTTTVKETAY